MSSHDATVKRNLTPPALRVSLCGTGSTWCTILKEQAILLVRVTGLADYLLTLRPHCFIEIGSHLGGRFLP